MLDPDCFWHIRVAEQLEREGIHPIVDQLSFASIKDPWTPYSWLAELGMKWVWDKHKTRLNRHLCKYMNPPLLSSCTLGYDYQWRSVVFWIAGPKDEREPGADSAREKRLMGEIFSEMDPNIAVMGFPYGGEGIGLGEDGGVALASRYGKGLVCSDFLDNT